MANNAAGNDDWGRRLQTAADQAGSLAARYLKTVGTAAALPRRLVRSARAGKFAFQGFAPPLFTVIVTWVVYAAVVASSSETFLLLAPRPVPAFWQLLTEGMSATGLLIAALPLT